MRKPKKKLKLKSRRGAVKRFKLTGTGKVKRYHAFKRHILTKKATGRKRHLRKSALVSKGEAPHVRRMLLG
jgi:large subunit ribosomal protein L35